MGDGGQHRLGVGSVNTILEDCATLAQLDYVPDLSSHSQRRGMATSAHRAGADFRDITKQGGHTDYLALIRFMATRKVHFSRLIPHAFRRFVHCPGRS